MRPKLVVRSRDAADPWVLGLTWTAARKELSVRGPARWADRMAWLLKEFWEPVRVRRDRRQRTARSWAKAWLRKEEDWKKGLALLQRRFPTKPVRRFGRLCT